MCIAEIPQVCCYDLQPCQNGSNTHRLPTQLAALRIEEKSSRVANQIRWLDSSTPRPAWSFIPRIRNRRWLELNMYTCICIYTYVYIYIYINVCVRVYVYIKGSSWNPHRGICTRICWLMPNRRCPNKNIHLNELHSRLSVQRTRANPKSVFPFAPICLMLGHQT